MEYDVPAASRRSPQKAGLSSDTGRFGPSVAIGLGAHQSDRRLPLGDLLSARSRSVQTPTNPHPELCRSGLACFKTRIVSSPLLAVSDLPFGTDVHRVDSLAQAQAQLPGRLAVGARVLKQRRGHSGIGIWRI